jgi:hypothetical protein
MDDRPLGLDILRAEAPRKRHDVGQGGSTTASVNVAASSIRVGKAGSILIGCSPFAGLSATVWRGGARVFRIHADSQ